MSRYQKTAEQKLEEVKAELVRDYLEERAEYFDSFLIDAASDSASPIERLMAMGLAHCISCESWHGGEGKDNNFNFVVGSDPIEVLKQHAPQRHGIEIWPEVQIGKYRADFVARVAHWRGGYCFGAIECDGHDYHDLTKEQASRDRKRDRAFQDLGLTILRYPGSDIWRSPLKCAADALNILERRAAQNPWRMWKASK